MLYSFCMIHCHMRGFLLYYYWRFKVSIIDTRGLRSITLVESTDSGAPSMAFDF